MKKTLCLLLLVAVCFSFCACEKMPNMNNLLSYQENNFQMNLRITDGEVFTASLQNENGTLTLYFNEEPLRGIGYRSRSADDLSVLFDDMEVPITNEFPKSKAWFSLFRTSAGDSVWKIKKETLGGISVFVCKNEEITIYFDATTLIPLKLVSGEAEIDVISVDLK